MKSENNESNQNSSNVEQQSEINDRRAPTREEMMRIFSIIDEELERPAIRTGEEETEMMPASKPYNPNSDWNLFL